MGLGTWATAKVGLSPEEKKAKAKEEKKGMQSRVKEADKAALVASHKAGLAPSAENHTAAAKAHRDASSAARTLYYGARASRAVSERVHDSMMDHERIAREHESQSKLVSDREKGGSNASTWNSNQPRDDQGRFDFK
jgi:hypothetical protein